MSKKLGADKSKGHRTRRQHTDKRQYKYTGGSGPLRPEDEALNQGIPEEHYYGERASRTPGNPSAFDEEARNLR